MSSSRKLKADGKKTKHDLGLLHPNPNPYNKPKTSIGDLDIRHKKDWCHLCGERTAPLMSFAIRRGEQDSTPSRYVRLCWDCVDAMNRVIYKSLRGSVKMT